MPTTTATKISLLQRWMGYQSDADDLALVQSQVTNAIADSYAFAVNGLQNIAATSLAVKIGAIIPAEGSTFTIGNAPTVYTIGLVPTLTTWRISPALVATAADNAVIRLINPVTAIVDQSCDRLLAMEDRIYNQALRMPHGNLYMINFMEASLEIKRLSNIIGLTLKPLAEQIWNPTAIAGWLASMMSPAVTPVISLPAFNYEDCILKVAPITSDTKPKNVAKGQIWNTITNPQTFEFDGWLWRGRTQGVNCGNFNIEIESTISHVAAGMIPTRIAGDNFAVGAGASASPLGLAIEYIRASIAYDNATGNKLKTSAVTAMIAVGVTNSSGTAGKWGKRAIANNNDSFQKPAAQTPPSGVPSDATEVWTDQAPPNFSTPETINDRRVASVDPVTSVPGAYLVNLAQPRDSVNLAVDTGAIAPALGVIFTIADAIAMPNSFLVNGLQAIGVSTLVVDTGSGSPLAGTTMTIGSDQTVYTIGSGATATSFPISPPLVVAAADNAVIQLRPDTQIYQVGAGATITNWLITPPLQRAVADNAVITIRGASLVRDDNRTTITAAGLTTNQGGKTSTVRKSTHVQGNLATGDYTYTSPASEPVYEYFEPLASFTRIGVCIRSVADAGQSLRVTGTVSGAYALTVAAN